MRHVLVTALALTMLSVAGAVRSAAQPAERSNIPTLTVVGQGRVDVPPDHARLTVAVVTTASTADSAAAAHRDRASRGATVLRDMKSDGLTILQSSFSLSEIRHPERPNVPARSEYRAAMTFELKVAPAANADKSVTAIAASGLFEVRNLRFGVEERNPGFNTARRDAVEDARRRATTYADAAGVKLGDILRIDDADPRHPREVVLTSPMARNMQIVPPETLTLSASVSIAWRIVP